MKIFKSFKNAIDGIIYTLKNERHMRIHSVASVAVLIFSLFFNLNAEKYAVLFLTIAFVLVCEMINTAFEGVIDVCSREYNAIAKAVKDIAAGAVLVSAVTSVIVGIFLFHDINAYINMFFFFIAHPFALLFLSVLAIFGYFYIFWGPTEMKNKVRQIIKIIKSKNSQNKNI